MATLLETVMADISWEPLGGGDVLPSLGGGLERAAGATNGTDAAGSGRKVAARMGRIAGTAICAPRVKSGARRR